MPTRRLFGADAKTELLPLCLSPDDLKAKLSTKTGLQDLVLESNRDHLISGRTYNTAGYFLQLFEYLDRKATVGEIIAASEEPQLTERSVLTSVKKINEILYKLMGIQIHHNKESGELRLVNEVDALQATEDFGKKFTKARDQFVRTMDAYRATGGDVAGLLASSEAGRKLAELGRVLSPAKSSAEEVAV